MQGLIENTGLARPARMGIYLTLGVSVRRMMAWRYSMSGAFAFRSNYDVASPVILGSHVSR